MQKILIYSTLMLFVSLKGYSQSNCRTGSMFMGVDYFTPSQTSGLLTFSTDLVFLKRYKTGYNTSFGIELNTGAKRMNKVIEDIEFEGGYNGYADYSISRFESWGKFLIGKRFNNVVEVVVPIKIGYRRLGYSQYFDIYSGQVIDSLDIADPSEAEESNSNLIGFNNNIGLGSGLAVAFFPKSAVSPFLELNYSIYSKTKNYEVENSSINQGIINIPQPTYGISNSLSFKVGLRFNFGACPSKTGDIYEPSSISRQSRGFDRSETVETTKTIEVPSTPEETETETKPNINKPTPEPQIILKPQVPTSPKPTVPTTPKPVIPN